MIRTLNGADLGPSDTSIEDPQEYLCNTHQWLSDIPCPDCIERAIFEAVAEEIDAISREIDS